MATGANPIDVKGINVNAIPKMITAINEYQKAINRPNLAIGSQVISKYLKGSKAAAELLKYTEQLDVEVSEMVKLLDKLETSLSEVKTAYAKQDDRAGSTIAGHTTKLKS